MAQKLINKQTISFLNQIQTIVSHELNQKSAIYYRHKIIEQLISDNNDKSDDHFIHELFKCDTNRCLKCLSHIKRWRIRPKPKFNQKRRKPNPNKLIGKCDFCLNVIRIDGTHKQRQPKNKSNQKRLKNIDVKKNSPTTKNSIEMKSDKRINVLQNLLSSSKKKRRDQKTGLFNFLQNCSQNH